MDLGIVLRSFRNGFDWLSDRQAYPWFGVMLVMWAIAYAANAFLGGIAFGAIIYVLDYAMKFISLFLVIPVAIRHYGMKTGFGSISFTAVKEWAKYTVINAVVQFFNWRDGRILIAQVIIAAAGVLIWFGGFDQQMAMLNALDQTDITAESLEGINLTLVSAGLLVVGLIWLLQTYNAIRYALLVQVRLTEGKDALDSVGKAWRLTDGRFFTTLALLLLWYAFSFIVNWAASFLGGMLFFLNGVAFSFLTVTWGFVFTNYYAALKGAAHEPNAEVPVQKRAPPRALRHKK